MKHKANHPGFRLSEFKDFILSLIKRRILIICLLLGLVVFLAPILFPEFLMAIVLGMFIIFVGFFWAAFLDHRDLLRKYQGSVVTVPREKNKRSGVAISFVRENEYLYSVGDPYAGQNLHITRMQSNKGIQCHFDERGIFFINGEVYYTMATGGLEINFRLFNSGDVPLDVLSIYVDDDLDLSHLRVYFDGVFLNGNKVRFPLRLEKGELVTIQSQHKISLGVSSTDSLFAADMRSLPKSILYDVIVNTSNDNGKRQSYVAELETPSNFLVDLYIKQWQDFDQQEYLDMAGHGDKDDV
ncbi:MAG TPA: hypothetical protein VLA72_01715 [Anaerolineales bacterium]|nr:hypothetical protein [Anaerolineales bacterium]